MSPSGRLPPVARLRPLPPATPCCGPVAADEREARRGLTGQRAAPLAFADVREIQSLLDAFLSPPNMLLGLGARSRPRRVTASDRQWTRSPLTDSGLPGLSPSNGNIKHFVRRKPRSAAAEIILATCKMATTGLAGRSGTSSAARSHTLVSHSRWNCACGPAAHGGPAHMALSTPPAPAPKPTRLTRRHLLPHPPRRPACRAVSGADRSVSAGGGGASYGLFVCSGSPALAEALCHSGLDWVCIDAQHGAVSYSSE